jgi:hypothetical protein
MKNILSLFAFCLIFLSSYAQKNMQDVVYLKNGTVVRGIIIEQIPNKSLKIKSNDNNVFVFDFIDIDKITKEENSGKHERMEKSDKNEKFFSNNKNNYFSIATGFGQSYGGLGIRLQGRHGRKLGFGYHGGVGYMPSGPAVFYSFGLKFFLYKAWYLNIQYGTTAIATYSSYFDYKEILYGPSFLIGGDWFFNKHIGLNGAFGIAKNITNKFFDTTFPTLDLGFVVKF